MPNQGDFDQVEPGIPRGTNADLLSSSGKPIHTEMGTDTFTSTSVHADSVLSSRDRFMHADTGGRPSSRETVGRVASVADTGKSRLASGLHDLGDRIESKGRQLESGNVLARPVGRVLDSTGDALESGANYLRSNDFGVIRDDFVEGIRHHPMLSAGIAIGCGWLLGQMMGGSDESDVSEERVEERHEDEHDEEEERSPSGLMGVVRGRIGNLVASGIASMAARQVRDRIAGR